MNKKQLLEEAHRLYPPGTIINSLGGCRNYECGKEYKNSISYNRSIDGITGYGVTLYSKGGWARVLQAVVPVENYSLY